MVYSAKLISRFFCLDPLVAISSDLLQFLGGNKVHKHMFGLHYLPSIVWLYCLTKLSSFLITPT